MELRQYYRILVRYRWVIVATTALCAGAMGLLLLTSGRTYESSVLIREQPVTMASSEVFGLKEKSSGTRQRVASLSTLATGGEVERRVRARLTALGKEGNVPFTVTAAPVGWSEMLKVSVRSPRRDQPPLIAEELVQQLSGYRRHLVLVELHSRRRFVEQGLAAARADYRKAQANLDHFKRKSGLLVVDTETKAELERLGRMRSDLIAASVDLEQLKARRRVWQSDLSGGLTMRAREEALAANPGLARLRTRLATQETELANLRLQYTDEHRLVKQSLREVERVRTQLRQETEKALRPLAQGTQAVPASLQAEYVTLETDYAAARAKQQSLAAVVTAAEKRLIKSVSQESNLAGLALARDSAMNAYSLFQTKLAQIVAEGKEVEGSNPVQVVEAATSSRPVDRISQRMLLSLFLGFALGIGLAMLLHYLDNTVQGIEDVRRLQFPVQAVIPINARPLAALGPGPKEGASEPYEYLRANLFPEQGEQEASAIMVTAAAPRAGKSTVSANLALVLARGGHRVLLVDADLRRPSQHLLFRLPVQPGLSDLLTGLASTEEAIHETAVPGLFLLPAGNEVSSPAGLLSSPRVEEYLEAMRARFDVTILDTPPGGAFADATFLARRIRRVLLVVAPGESLREVESDFCGQLDRMGAVVVGTVLNKARPSHLEGYASYYYYDRGRRRAARGEGARLLHVTPALPVPESGDGDPPEARGPA